MRVRVALVAAVALSDCLDPTEIIVVVSTDVPCSAVNSTAIAVGRPGDDTNFTVGKTAACSADGGIGSLVVTPSHGIDEDVGIRVTLGIGATRADDCVAPKFDGCIVARRSLAYFPHHPLTLPVTMQQICENTSCDPTSTCVNGSCVDAGAPPCDQTGTCAIDAGPCDVPPKLVTPVVAQVTPHLVQTNGGYAVAWETTGPADPARAYDVVALDADGNAGKVVQMTNQISSGSFVGALGTDGTNLAATFVPSTGSYTVREIDPNGNVNATATGQGFVQLPRQGMLHDTVLKGYVFFFVDPTLNASFGIWQPGSLMPGTNGVGTGSPNDTALARLGSTYFGTFHDGSSCYVVTGDFSTTGASVLLASTWPRCSTLRLAENAKGVDLSAARESDPNNPQAFTLHVRASTDPPAASQVIDAVDDQAIVVLPGVGNAFHVVYGISQSVRETTIDTSLNFTAPKTIANATGFAPGVQGSTGFDAIGAPGSMVHAIVFWASAPTPGIYFTRICN